MFFFFIFLFFFFVLSYPRRRRRRAVKCNIRGSIHTLPHIFFLRLYASKISLENLLKFVFPKYRFSDPLPQFFFLLSRCCAFAIVRYLAFFSNDYTIWFLFERCILSVSGWSESFDEKDFTHPLQMAGRFAVGSWDIHSYVFACKHATCQNCQAAGWKNQRDRNMYLVPFEKPCFLFLRLCFVWFQRIKN